MERDPASEDVSFLNRLAGSAVVSQGCDERLRPSAGMPPPPEPRLFEDAFRLPGATCPPAHCHHNAGWNYDRINQWLI